MSTEARQDGCAHGPEHFGFLCSTFGEDGMPELRREIYVLGENHGLPIWVSEFCDPELRPGEALTDLDIIDGCMDAVRASHRLFLVTTGAFGTSLSHNERHLTSSYVEMELFQGAILERPIHVLVVGDIDTGSRLGQLLRMLELSFPQRFLANVDSKREVAVEIERVLSSVKRPVARTRVGARNFVGTLASIRHRDWDNVALGDEIQFLDGVFDEQARRPDKDHVKLLLSEADRATGMQRRIARVWLAIRELMSAPFNKPEGVEYLELWHNALGKWSSFAAWSGLHAHVFLGHLAALGSIYTIRQRLKDRGIHADEGRHTTSTDGAFASCYYSLSKLAPQKQAEKFLSRSCLYVEQGLAQTPRAKRAGLHAIRGSAYLRKGNVSGAIADYQSALQIAEEANAGDAVCGEYLAELGWAEVRRGKVWIGRKHLEEGVRLMHSADPGFVVRGKRKLAFANIVTGRFRAGGEEAAEALRLAERHQLNGQLNSTLRLAARLGSRSSPQGPPKDQAEHEE